MTLLSGSIQPPLLTLLSSTSTPPLSPLFAPHIKTASPDAFIAFTQDDEHHSVTNAGPRFLGASQSNTSSSSKRKINSHNTDADAEATNGSIAHEVIHIQSPDLRMVYIQAGTSATLYGATQGSEARRGGHQKTTPSEQSYQPLGIELPWLGMQIKRLGRREMSFEIGLVDSKGREGVVRISSFEKNPTSHPSRTPPLIHLPLHLPSPSSSSNINSPSSSTGISVKDTRLTEWSEISINLGSLIPLFQKLPRAQRRRAASSASSSASSSGSSSSAESSASTDDEGDYEKGDKTDSVGDGEGEHINSATSEMIPSPSTTSAPSRSIGADGHSKRMKLSTEESLTESRSETKTKVKSSAKVRDGANTTTSAKSSANSHLGSKQVEPNLPAGNFGYVTYVRVYANCRLRRIWFSAEGKTLENMGSGTQNEWALYAADTIQEAGSQ